MIEINNLHKKFGEKTVLNGLSMTIPDGTTSCIIGKSGCGKSVLLKHIVGLLEADSGEIIIDGKNISTLTNHKLYELRKTIGFVFQGAALFDSLNVFENVVIGLYEHGQRDLKLLESEAKRTLIDVGLLPDPQQISESEFQKEWNILINKKPADLSGGMRKRVGIARALVGSPRYIFYDEPTTGLDPVTSEQIDSLIYDLAKNQNATSIIITHDMFSVTKIADHVAMIDEGKLRFEGNLDDFLISEDDKIIEFLERYRKNFKFSTF